MGASTSPVVHMLPAVLFSMAALWVALPLRWLTGLRCYYAAASKEGEAAARGGGRKVVKPRGRSARGGAAPSDDYDLGGAESLVVVPLSLPVAAQLTYRGALENLVFVSLLALCSLAFGLATERLLGWPASAMPPLLAFGLGFTSLFVLAQVDLLSPTTSPTNKALAVVWGVLGLSAALALHVLQPGGGRLLAWDLKRAAAAVGPLLNAAVKAAAEKATKKSLEASGAHVPTVVMPDSALQIALALAAAALAVLLFAPAQRFVRSYFLHMRPPEWGLDYVAPGALASAGLTLHLVLPLLSSLLWVRPMFQELFDLPDGVLVLVQAAALLTTAAAMAANLRPLLQRYLDRGLTGWYQLKHGSRAARGNKDDKRNLGELIRVHCQATNFLLGKAAVQALAPAALYLAFGLMLLHSALQPVEAGTLAAEAQALVESCVGFLAFWTGACWFSYSAGLLWAFRTGMLQP